MLCIFTIGAVLALTVTAAAADETVKISSILRATVVESQDVGDVDDHSMSLTRYSGLTRFSDGTTVRRLSARQERRGPLPVMSRQTVLRMEIYESAPLFKADNATLSFYSTKDGKIRVSYQGWDQSKTVLAGQTVCAELGASTPCGPNQRCPSAQVC